MNNLRFATLLHILVLAHHSQNNLEENCPQKVLTSEFIAGSININPVVVRKEIKVLKDAQLLAVKKGKEGGYYLIQPAHQILLSDILQLAMSDTPFGKMNQPNMACAIGKQINHELKSIYSTLAQAMIDALKSVTLAEFSNQFKNIHP